MFGDINITVNVKLNKYNTYLCVYMYIYVYTDTHLCVYINAVYFIVY